MPSFQQVAQDDVYKTKDKEIQKPYLNICISILKPLNLDTVFVIFVLKKWVYYFI